jgi:predicted permease
MRNLWQDLTFGMRMLRKNLGFTAVAVLTLGLGIGANTALFSIVDWLLLRPLPIAQPEQLTNLTFEQKGQFSNGFSYPDYLDIRNGTSEMYSDVAGYDIGMDGITADGKTQPIQIGYVTGNFFQMCGIRPLLGRFILPSEGAVQGADPVLVLSYSYWTSRFGADPNVVGKKVAVDGTPATIVGVAPKGFHGVINLFDTQGYMPTGMKSPMFGMATDFLTNRSARSMLIMARLRSGATLEQARAALRVIGDRLSKQYPDVDGGMQLKAWNVGPMGPASGPGQTGLEAVAGLFLGLALLVLVLACLNVANMLLVRATARQREMAIRTALGAARGRLIRQLLAESALLAACGCAAGIFFGVAASRGISSLNLHTSLPIILDFQFDWRVFAYAFGVTALTGILAGLVPALRASRANLADMLHDASRGSSAGRQRLRAALVAAQVAGSMMLLVIAGLFTRSLAKAQFTDLGFDPTHVLNFTIDPHEIGYNEAQGREFFKQLLPRIESLPGVKAASVAATVPGGEIELGSSLDIEGRAVEPGRPKPDAGFNYVTPHYFETMGIPVLRGRAFTDADEQNSQFVALIDERMASSFWPNQDPIGRRFTTKDDPKHSIAVIGVVRNTQSARLTDQNTPFFFAPLSQHYISFVTLQVRAFGAPESVATPVIQAAQSIAPTMPVYNVQTMTQALNGIGGIFLFKLGAGIAASLGILGLALATIGLYGVVSFAATQRTREIGIRMALGARPSAVLAMICQRGLVIIAIGLAIGAALALAVGRLIGSLLIGVSGTDPLTYIAVAFTLALVGSAASYIPALRASRVDPIIALRHE